MGRVSRRIGGIGLEETGAVVSVLDGLVEERGVDAEPAKAYCNVLAAALGLHPAGHAGTFDDAVVVETALPWRKRMYDEAGPLPQELIDLMAGWLADYHAGKPYNHRPLLIAPDPAVSVDGLRTVIFYVRPRQPFARFAKMAYRVPEEALGPLIWAWYMDPARLAEFDGYRHAEADGVRDILVCTHGTVDVACGKFGFPLYKALRERYHEGTSTRVWRVSHFGGHVFAPTLLDMPTGHYWAYVGAEQADQIAMRTGDVTALAGHYRGWAGAERGFVQAAEWAIWQREGWRWFDYAKQGEIVEADPADNPAWAVVRMGYATPENGTGIYTARVEVRERITTVPSTGTDRVLDYAQYAVTDLAHHSAA